MDQREWLRQMEILKRQNERLREENRYLRTVVKRLREEMMLMKPMSELELFEKSFKNPRLKAYLKRTGFFERMRERQMDQQTGQE